MYELFRRKLLIGWKTQMMQAPTSPISTAVILEGHVIDPYLPVLLVLQNCNIQLSSDNVQHAPDE
jgi:hypothetical protein